MPTNRPLTGKVVAVTGGGQGIGRAIAFSLARAGADVLIGDLDGAAAERAAHEISEQTGARVGGLSLDVTYARDFAEFLHGAEAAFGPVDVLVNNAGVMWVGPFADEPAEEAARQITVNLHGVLHGMKLAIPAMRRRGQGHVVTIASAASKLAPAGEATYTATKHAVYGYCSAVRAELRGSGVDVSMVLPGVVDTALAVGTSTGPVRLLRPEDVAAAVLRVILRPRFEVFVPKHIGVVPRLAALLPDPLRDLLYRLVVPDQLRRS
ncbi:hypothetical protein EV193_10660 [Herbihabitans rhizosphaerae]|uniref:Short-subunit dehydrogenase n=1 Tax=Herbihabitans rhizosphaerae TaxID=1872711 RepID=A0A4Q7KKT2_9PSEU|nr:SDR family oxidoreductase [Herbihabitans rhizosphaerae]RZS36826.1 hypothetical protein EV193_10660 [Herbihabitans rhizosphaerae]